MAKKKGKKKGKSQKVKKRSSKKSTITKSKLLELEKKKVQEVMENGGSGSSTESHVDDSKFQIIMKDEVYDKVHALMKFNDKLNDGNEIGGWLTGDWGNVNGKAVLLLDNFIIPEQTVSRTEVDMSPENMANLVKLIGPEQCNRIKAHWHIHPFGTGKTDWSGVDESKIQSFMNPEKERDVFVFILSSNDWIKARVEMNVFTKPSIFDKKVVFKYRADDLPVYRANPLEVDDKMFKQLKKEIGSRVVEYKYENKWKDNGSSVTVASSDEYDSVYYRLTMYMPYQVLSHKLKLVVRLMPEFELFIQEMGGLSDNFDDYVLYETGKKNNIYTFEFGSENDKSECRFQMEDELVEFYELFYQEYQYANRKDYKEQEPKEDYDEQVERAFAQSISSRYML